MALTFLHDPLSTLFPTMILASFVFLNRCDCFNPKLLHASKNYETFDPNWSPAGATWYGSPSGAGSDGGACGFTDTVERPPYSAMVSAGGPSIYVNGTGCGECYEVKCTDNAACSGNAVTVTITDECPGCTSETTHFDLSGTAFGAMAKPGLADQLRNAGVLQIQHRSVKCNYPGVTVVVRVDPGSNPYYFASAIEYADGTGIQKVELQQQPGGWMTMQQSSGAIWALNAGYVLKPPFSMRLTEAVSGRTLILNNVIPNGWSPGQTYRSHVNFDNY